jgi:hypothetical protein
VSIEVTKAATTAQYGGSGAAVYFGLTANEIAAFGGHCHHWSDRKRLVQAPAPKDRQGKGEVRKRGVDDAGLAARFYHG